MKHILLSSFTGLLKYFGLEAPFIIAGLAGGITFISKNSSLSKWQKFLSVVSGGFAANYLTPIVAEWMDLTDKVLYGIAFLLGYGGLKSIEWIFLIFSGNLNPTKNENP
ncbi:hypothetical protein ACLI1A_13450 [Flavobacterium sp. RHBU_3]|uniref:hypothetical protein n=1 Tax=Flavobacterium sp. RHBU_3 TaxID=3391184 RepID=UPI003984ECC8